MSGKVALFIAGVQKAGTTTLDALLRFHPSLSGPSIKETHVFDDETLDWRAPPLERLHAYYPPEKEGVLRFEATPITSFWPPALGRVQRYNPQARIILILRDPIARAWSHWSMEWHRGTESLGFSEAIRQGRERVVEGELGAAQRDFSYVERGFYAAQVRRTQELFPDQQVLVLEFGALFRDVPGSLARIADFAGLAPFPRVPEIWENRNRDPGSGPSAADVALLQEVFAQDARLTADLTGLDLSRWLTLRRG